MTDPAYQPQPDPKDNRRRTPAERGEPSSIAPDELRDVDPGDATAEKALKAIEAVRQKLEPRG
ncbi:MAG: hypothetical protein ABW136_11665 [Steroidobacteraceae bacterium]